MGVPSSIRNSILSLDVMVSTVTILPHVLQLNCSLLLTASISSPGWIGGSGSSRWFAYCRTGGIAVYGNIAA
jgi:hypothetical protein